MLVLVGVSMVFLDEWLGTSVFTWLPDAIGTIATVGADGEPLSTGVLIAFLTLFLLANAVVGPITAELYLRGHLPPASSGTAEGRRSVRSHDARQLPRSMRSRAGDQRQGSRSFPSGARSLLRVGEMCSQRSEPTGGSADATPSTGPSAPSVGPDGPATTPRADLPWNHAGVWIITSSRLGHGCIRGR
jgi:hypothetical protein